MKSAGDPASRAISAESGAATTEANPLTAHAHAVGLLRNVDLHGLYDLALLNQVLAEHGQPRVQGL